MFIRATARKNKDGSRIEYLQLVHKGTKASSLVKRVYKAFGLKLSESLRYFLPRKANPGFIGNVLVQEDP